MALEDCGTSADRAYGGGDRVDGGGSMEHGHRRMTTGPGSAPTPHASVGAAEPLDWKGDGSGRCGTRVSSTNGSATAEAETPWKGLKNDNIYVVWNHGWPYLGGFDCLYCKLKSRGGGATCFREHLGCITGEVRGCPSVPRNVRDAMKESRADSKKKKRDKQNKMLRIERNIMDGLYYSGGVIDIPIDDEEEVQMSLREALRDKNVSRRIDMRTGSRSGGEVRVAMLLSDA